HPVDWNPVDFRGNFSTVRLAALLLLLTATASAAPVIEVRARTRLSVDTVTRTGSGVHVRGSLTDAVTGDGISGRYVQVQAAAASLESVATGGGGRFDAYVELPVGQHAIGARFVGDASFGDSAFDARAFDVDKATLVLEVHVDGPVDTTAARVIARIGATSGEGPERVRVQVRAGDAVGGGGLRSAGSASTHARGAALGAVPRALL